MDISLKEYLSLSINDQEIIKNKYLKLKNCELKNSIINSLDFQNLCHELFDLEKKFKLQKLNLTLPSSIILELIDYVGLTNQYGNGYEYVLEAFKKDTEYSKKLDIFLYKSSEIIESLLKYLEPLKLEYIENIDIIRDVTESIYN